MQTHLFVMRQPLPGWLQVTAFVLYVPPAVSFSTATYPPWNLCPNPQQPETLAATETLPAYQSLPVANLN